MKLSVYNNIHVRHHIPIYGSSIHSRGPIHGCSATILFSLSLVLCYLEEADGQLEGRQIVLKQEQNFFSSTYKQAPVLEELEEAEGQLEGRQIVYFCFIFLCCQENSRIIQSMNSHENVPRAYNC